MAEMEEAWDAKAKGLLKAELKRRNVTYSQLVEKLAAIGVMVLPSESGNTLQFRDSDGFLVELRGV